MRAATLVGERAHLLSAHEKRREAVVAPGLGATGAGIVKAIPKREVEVVGVSYNADP